MRRTGLRFRPAPRHRALPHDNTAAPGQARGGGQGDSRVPRGVSV